MVYSGSEKRPPMMDMLRNISIILLDVHHTSEIVRPLQPNIIPIGGIHLARGKTLPAVSKKLFK